MKTALTIAGTDPSGGAGIQADIKTMTANGVYAMSAVTALVAQNTTGVTSILEVSPDFLAQQLDCVFTDIFPDAVKTGMVSSIPLIHTIADKLAQYGAHDIVVDPVMVATSGDRLISEDAVDALKERLFPLAAVLTPNIPEAEILSGMTIRSPEDMVRAGRAIAGQYGCAVLCKGGHRVCDANDVLVRPQGEERWFQSRRVDNPNTHGTGCTLSSAIASGLAKGYDLETSIQRSKDFLTGALSAMLDLGKGSGPLDHLFDLKGGFLSTIAPAVTALFTVGYLAVTAWLCRGLRLDARALAYGGLTCALTLVLANIFIPLPTGSAITAGSMLPLMLLALVYDPRLAFLTGWTAGLLALFLLPLWAPVHWAQIFVEHLTAFSCLGYAGLFGRDRRWKVVLGVGLAILLRFTGQVLSGVIFFSDNAWDGWGAWAYSLTYHLSSKVPEGIASAAILAALPLGSMERALKGGTAR